MPTRPLIPPKPRSEVWRPDLTRLPRLHGARRSFRIFARGLCSLVIGLCTHRRVEGLENFPRHGPALVVINHLGDADAVLLVGSLPVAPDALGKIELFDLTILGKLMDWYGVIWLHRGQADRRALRAALQGFSENRIIVIAPEGRYSLIRGLEEGSHGAAYLAVKADIEVVPVVVIGTENERIYGHLKRLRRAQVSLRIGKPFRIIQQPDHRETLRAGTRQIMQHLAALLPEEYRGAYGDF
jgi:1-acyl-sn-glycerol-3-phosphate acyltransferase